MQLELRHLRYFVTVADELHFGRAAHRLRIAQPGLSLQIQGLERLLGVQLFLRNRRSVSLTEAGRLFLEEARLTIAQADRATNIGQRAGRGELGKVELGYVPSAAFTRVLSDTISVFRNKHPNVKIHPVKMHGVRQLEELASGRLDISFIRKPIPFPRGIASVTVLVETVIVAMKEDHPLSQQTEIEESRLAEETFIILQVAPGVGLHEYTMAVGRAGGFAPKKVHHGSDIVDVASMVSLGLGVAIMPASSQCLQLPNVVFRPLKSGKLRANLSAVYRENEQSPAVLAFIETVRLHGNES